MVTAFVTEADAFSTVTVPDLEGEGAKSGTKTTRLTSLPGNEVQIDDALERLVVSEAAVERAVKTALLVNKSRSERLVAT